MLENIHAPVWIGGLAIGLIASFWQRAKMLATRLSSLLVCQIHIDTGHANQAIMRYAHRNFRRTPGGIRTYSSIFMRVRPLARERVVVYETLQSQQGGLFWKGWRPIWIGSVGGDVYGVKDAQQSQSGTAYHTGLFFLRGTFDADDLLIESTREYDAMTHGMGQKGVRFSVIRKSGMGAISRRGHSGQVGEAVNSAKGDQGCNPDFVAQMSANRLLEFSLDDLGPEIVEDAIGRMALCSQAREMVLEVRRWKESRTWHLERGLPWRRGILLVSPPGNGKTSLVKAIACDLDLPVCAFDLGSMSNDELHRNWESMTERTPCIALIEDIDGVFHGRENILGELGGCLSFDAFLNCIGGINTPDGVLLVVTTNHPEHLDPAIGTDAGNEIGSRPGRVDRVINLKAPDVDGRRKMARRIMDGCPAAMIEQTVSEGKNDSGAVFQERCARIALQRFWGDGERMLLSA